MSLRAKRSTHRATGVFPVNLLCLRDCFVALLLAMTGLTSYSQDTINFKAFDSLKTSAEDNHKSVLKSKPIDSSDIKSKGDAEFLKNFNSTNTKSDPDNWDVRLFRKINNARSPFKDKYLDLFTRSNAPIAVLMPMSLFVYGRMADKTFDENSAYLLAGAEAVNFTITMGTKLFIKRKRPVEALPDCYSKGNSSLDVYSFPSGHSSTSFTIATMFALRYSKYPLVYVPMYAWAAVVAYSRPYFGMHYPTDLIAGALVGTGSSILIYSLRKHLFKFKNNIFDENKNDEGSINSGVATFFVGSFVASSLFNTFILKPKDVKKFSLSPWMDDKRSGLNFNYRF